jgi:intracellular septation protein
MSGETTKPRRTPNGWANFGLDFGPLLVFFAAYELLKRSLGSLLAAIASTFVFMIAILAAMAISLYFYRRVSPMMWISAALVIGFGGLTIYFHDPRFIQLKPTLIFGGFSLLLFGGLVAGRPLLKHIFGPIFEGLSEAGWMKISRNWACFFGAMAILNEVLRVTVTFDTWMVMKVWGITALSLLFGAANVPMLLRHGLTIADAEPEPPATPGA